MSTHALYRFFGSADQLLYIGITLNPASRFTQHRHDKPWWAEVARITLEPYPTREAVIAAERRAIGNEQPIHNVIHNGRVRRSGGVRQYPRSWPAEAMPDMCHDRCVKADPSEAIAYFPYRWSGGVAEYVCRRGHRWTCGWGHKGSGEASVPPVDMSLNQTWPDPGDAPCGHSWVEPGSGIPDWCGCRYIREAAR